MENKIKIDFSKIEEITISQPKKTIWAICITSVVTIVIVKILICQGMTDWNSITIILLIILLLLFAFILGVLYILCKLEYTKISHEIEIKKANADLHSKLAEEAIMREIKIQEKEISDAQKCKYDCDKQNLYKDLENYLNNLKLLCSIKCDDDCKKEVNNIIKSIENKLSELKNLCQINK